MAIYFDLVRSRPDTPKFSSPPAEPPLPLRGVGWRRPHVGSFRAPASLAAFDAWVAAAAARAAAPLAPRPARRPEDEEERAEREQRERERKEQREYEKEQRRLAKEKKRAAKKQADVEEAAFEKEGTLSWTFKIPMRDGVTDEEPFEISLRATKPRFAHASSVDTQSWDGEHGLHAYLRKKFLDSGDDKTIIGLKGQVLFDGEPKLHFNNVCDQVSRSQIPSVSLAC
jgi:hypothetical protein